MQLECIVCASGLDDENQLLSEDPDAKGTCHGVCNNCGVFVCNAHGTRVPKPLGYLCVMCIPEEIQRGFRFTQDPRSPTDPPATIDTVTKAISAFPDPVKSKVIASAEDFQKDKGRPKGAPLGWDGLKLVAEKLREEAHITELVLALGRRLVH
jgi:hypothetical protein